jgi:hypothetical protein
VPGHPIMLTADTLPCVIGCSTGRWVQLRGRYGEVPPTLYTDKTTFVPNASNNFQRFRKNDGKQLPPLATRTC